MHESEFGIPQWKKELLLRRRTLTRALTAGAGGVQLRVSCPTGLRADSVPLVQSYGKHPRWSSHQSPPSDFLPDNSVRNMRFLDQDLSSCDLIKCNSDSDSDIKAKMVEEKPDKKPSFRSMDKSKEDKHSNPFIDMDKKRVDEDYHSDSSEELQYGPGIVNKLKSKYLSMTLRDNQKHSSRPSLSNLRRATSLENMLDDDANRLQQKPHFIKKPYHTNIHRSSKISQHHAKYLGLSRGSESMKRARSMDTLLKNDTKNNLNHMNNSTLSSGYSNGSVTPSIINEDLIIVDNDSSDTIEEKAFSKSEDTELPPHDLVKQTLKLFETSVNKKPTDAHNKVKTAVSKIINSNTRPTNNSDTPPSKLKPSKPILGPKPVITTDKRLPRPKVGSPKRVFPVVSSIDKPKQPVIAPKICPIGDSKKFTSPVISPKVSPTIESKKISRSTIVGSVQRKINSCEALSPPGNAHQRKSCDSEIHTPPMNSVQKKIELDAIITSTPLPSFNTQENLRLSVSPVSSESGENGMSPVEDKPKYISQKARDGISKEGMSMKFSFNDKPIISDKSYLPRAMPQATNTALISSQGDTTPIKQVAVIRPVVKNKVLTDQEIEKNLINKVKTVESKLSESEEKGVSDKPPLWAKKTWQSQNTMVFNFSDRKSVPDYIENDGTTLTSRRGSKVS